MRQDLKHTAIMLVHGIGRQHKASNADIFTPTYSKHLYQAVRRKLRRQSAEMAGLAWAEVDYAQVFNAVQADYYARLGHQIKRSRLRQLMIENFGDAAAYRPDKHVVETSSYARVQAEVRRILMILNKVCRPEAPLIIIAHSLGGQVIADYIRQARYEEAGFTRLETLQTFITFGCNIPLFHMGEPYDSVSPPPIHHLAKMDKPGWLNYYDRDDVLGYPLAPTGQRYQKLADTGFLQDIPVNAGGLLSRWNTLSHLKYWTHSTIIEGVCGAVMRAWES